KAWATGTSSASPMAARGTRSVSDRAPRAVGSFTVSSTCAAFFFATRRLLLVPRALGVAVPVAPRAGLARLEERHEELELAGSERARERGHVRAAVRDADRELVLREQVADRRELRSAPAAIGADEVAVETSLVVEQERAVGDGTRSCADGRL